MGEYERAIGFLQRSLAGYRQHVGPDHFNTLASMIALWGYTVETACDGQEALDKLAEFPAHVIVTDLDLTTGLLGAHTWGIVGYHPDYARSLVKNIILWTVDGPGN